MILQSKLSLGTARIFVKSGLDREEGCDVTKIQTCELMGLVSILRKNKLKKMPSPRIRLLLLIGEKKSEPVCSDDVIHILLKLAWIVTSTIQAYFRIIYMESSDHNLAYSPHQFALSITSEHFFFFLLDVSTNSMMSQI